MIEAYPSTAPLGPPEGYRVDTKPSMIEFYCSAQVEIRLRDQGLTALGLVRQTKLPL